MSKGANDTIIAKIEQSANQPVFLYQLKVDDTTYHRFAGLQTEDLIFNGFIWQAAAITHDPINSAQDGSIDATSIKLAGISSELVAYLTTPGNSMNGYEVQIFKVFRDALDDPNNYIVEFAGEIDGGSYNGKVISVSVRRHLGSFSRIIPGEAYGVLCPLRFKATGDGECNYTGSVNTCKHTLANCKALSNQDNYGGFPWIPIKKK